MLGELRVVESSKQPLDGCAWRLFPHSLNCRDQTLKMTDFKTVLNSAGTQTLSLTGRKEISDSDHPKI